jgi:hypothetical protein
MNRRAAVRACFAPLACGLAARAAAGLRKLGVLFPADPASSRFVAALGEKAWPNVAGSRGRNLRTLYALRGQATEEVVAGFVREPVDVIFAPGIVGAQSARFATTIPIVFRMGPDPVPAGLVRGFARPGGNLTGIAGFMGEVSGKKFELLRELMPKARRVALLVDRDHPNAQTLVQPARQAAQDFGSSCRWPKCEKPPDSSPHSHVSGAPAAKPSSLVREREALLPVGRFEHSHTGVDAG